VSSTTIPDFVKFYEKLRDIQFDDDSISKESKGLSAVLMGEKGLEFAEMVYEGLLMGYQVALMFIERGKERKITMAMMEANEWAVPDSRLGNNLE